MTGTLRAMATVGDVIIQRYELLGQLDRGGSGELWVVLDRNLDKKVATKLPLPEALARPEVIEQFEKEAKLAGRVDHPNVANVTDFGVDPEHGIFLCQELIEGPTLASRLYSGDMLSFEEGCRLAVQLGSALAGIHAKGIAHRDLHPGNIIINPARGAVIVDFGLAKDEYDAGPRSSLNRTGPFIAPERRPDSIRVLEGDERFACDYYSLGVVLYESFTSRTPIGPMRLPWSDRMIPAPLMPLIRTLLLEDPVQRLRAKDMLTELAPPERLARGGVRGRLLGGLTPTGVATALTAALGVGLLSVAGYVGAEAILRATG